MKSAEIIFHLLPVQLVGKNKWKEDGLEKRDVRAPRRLRAREKGKGKSKDAKSRVPRMPTLLAGGHPNLADGRPVCFDYSLKKCQPGFFGLPKRTA